MLYSAGPSIAVSYTHLDVYKRQPIEVFTSIKEIKNKVKNGNLILTKADKSQATVIIEKADYIKKADYMKKQ